MKICPPRHLYCELALLSALFAGACPAEQPVLGLLPSWEGIKGTVSQGLDGSVRYAKDKAGKLKKEILGDPAAPVPNGKRLPATTPEEKLEDALDDTVDKVADMFEGMLDSIPESVPEAVSSTIGSTISSVVKAVLRDKSAELYARQVKGGCAIPLSDDQKFILACMYRDAETISSMLENGYNPNASVPVRRGYIVAGGNTRPMYATPLYLLVDLGAESELVRTLLEHGADPARRAEDGTCGDPVWVAVRRYRLDLVKLLVEYKAPVQEMGSDETAPGFAAKFGRMSLLKGLFQAGANVHAKNKAGQTVLHEALSFPASYLCIKDICKQGADVNAVDAAGRTPLMYVLAYTPTQGQIPAANWPVTRKRLVKLLLRYGAKPDAGCLHGYTTADVAYILRENIFGAYAPPASLQAMRGMMELCNCGEFDAKAADALLPALADIDAYTPYGDTLLTLAARKGNAAMLFYLLEKGADPNKRTSHDVNVGSWDRWGAGVDSRSAMGLLRKHCAGHTEMVEALLKHGFTPQWGKKSPGDWPGTDHAGSLNNGEELLLLFRDPARRKDFPLALMPDLACEFKEYLPNIDFLDFFSEQTTRDLVHERDEQGHTLLMLTMLEGKLSRELLKRGADANATNHAGQNLLMLASNVSGMETALAAGVDVHATDAEGNTALHYAVRFPCHEVLPAVKLLLQSGIDVSAKNNAGQTALDLFQEYSAINLVDAFFDSPEAIQRVLDEYPVVLQLLRAQ